MHLQKMCNDRTRQAILGSELHIWGITMEKAFSLVATSLILAGDDSTWRRPLLDDLNVHAGS